MKSHGKQPNRQITSPTGELQVPSQKTLLPPVSLSFATRLVFVACVVAWAAVTIREPLWIDELHTLWAIQGDWQEVVSRSAAGNQSPLYFYVLKVFVDVAQYSLQTLGLDSASFIGVILRSSSLIGWGMLSWWMSLAISSCFSGSEKSWGDAHGILIAILFVGGLWMMSDRTGGFYATEARPYVWVAVACSLMIIKATPTVGFSWRFVLYGVAAFYLHYTALAVIAAIFLLRSISCFRDGMNSRLILYEGFILAILMTPGLLHLAWLGKSSSQWAYFAGGSDLFTLLRIFPWFAWVLFTAVCVGMSDKFRSLDRAISKEESSLFQVVVWLTVICLFTHWLLSFLGWAPLMHSRYLIGTYPAIWIAGMLLLKKLNDVRWIIAVGLFAMGVQGWLQGSWPLWGRGEWIAWQRVEDWDKAFDVLMQNKQTGDLVFLAPFLIETEDQQKMNSSPAPRQRYFKFPIEALSIAKGVPVPEQVVVLANSTSSWESTIKDNLVRMNDREQEAWLLARTSQTWTSSIASEYKIDRELFYEGGNLQLWRLRQAK